MNQETALLVTYAIAAFLLWVLPLALCYREGQKINQVPLCVLAGLFLGWVGWIAVKIIASGRQKQEAKDQANAEAMLRHRMRQARGDLID
ncbi:MAG: hypothetical protein KDK97_11810 [Verrucomicrobiales bacterium]|nr:hypothetical protein [Verrucomicrobiales bacterium]